jgi:clan AA aspartic protease
MELIYADLELVRADDLALQRAGYLDAGKVRHIHVSALVDSGAYQLCINENIRIQLELPEVERITAELADGSLAEMAVVGPVEIRFKTRRTVCNAAVLPGNAEVLLGSIPMEDMDLVLYPKEEVMDVNPATPYLSKKKIKYSRQRGLSQRKATRNEP